MRAAIGCPMGVEKETAGNEPLAETRNGMDPPSPANPSPGAHRDSALKIAIVDENPVRAAILQDGLREAGFVQIECIGETRNLLARIYTIDPDVILIDLENPSRDVLEQMFQMSRAVKRPVAMFVDHSDSASIQAAVDAGVSAYIVDGLKKERKVIDRAKGVLMKAKRLTEDEAYALMRKTAMNENKKIVEIAQSVLTAAELLK